MGTSVPSRCPTRFARANKGPADNALRRAVFFHRKVEARDRTFENQGFRASGLSLITAAIVYRNTVSHPGVAAGVLGIFADVVEQHYNRAGQSMAASAFDQVLKQRRQRMSPESPPSRRDRRLPVPPAPARPPANWRPPIRS